MHAYIEFAINYLSHLMANTICRVSHILSMG